MHEVPAHLDLSPFRGCELVQVRIGRHQLQILFDGDHSIACEGRTIVESTKGIVTVLSDDGWGNASPLPEIVGAIVTDWAVEGSHEFSVTLSSGHKIRFVSTDGPYEDFVIDGGACVV